MKRHLPTFFVMVIIPAYVLGAFVAEVLTPQEDGAKEEATLTLSFVGDMMFDRYIRAKAEVHGYPSILDGTRVLFDGSDVVVGNLEGPISTLPSVSDWKDTGPNHYRFTFATSVAETLAGAGFKAVTLANNHIYNFGEEGYMQTEQWLKFAGVGFFGSPKDPYAPWRYASGTVSVVMYAFDVWYARDVEEIVKRIQSEPEQSFVVVYAHWGDEYETIPNDGQREVAKRFVDAGADLVVGSHPHVIQTKEQYKEKWVYYSLGNFVFDQYFNEEVRCGAVLHVTISEDLTYTTHEDFVTLERDGTTKQSTCKDAIVMD